MRLQIIICALNDGAEGYAPAISTDTEEYESRAALLRDLAGVMKLGPAWHFDAVTGSTFVFPHALLARSFITVREVTGY